MREIKFRAWDKVKNEWLLGYEYPNLGGFNMIGEIMMMGEYTALLTSYFPDHLNDIVIMQYTGLKDKNGVEIYEGDIVKTNVGKHIWHYRVRCYTEFDGNIYGDTIYRNFTSQEDEVDGSSKYLWGDYYLEEYSRKTLYGSERTLEVIGNIYENPELLKEEI